MSVVYSIIVVYINVVKVIDIKDGEIGIVTDVCVKKQIKDTLSALNLEVVNMIQLLD